MQVVLLFLLASIKVIQTIEPITTSIVVGGALSAGVVYQFWDDKIKVYFIVINSIIQKRNIGYFDWNT